jgi:nucleoside-diphosphate-sugar epimerase
VKKVLVTGSQGFIGSYLCQELLKSGYKVIGIDNFSKYGPIARPQDDDPNFTLFEMDVCDVNDRPDIFSQLMDVDYIIAGAAMIGGITYFHKYAYDLLAQNERIMAATFDLAIRLHREAVLQRILVISSSMVFENTEVYPTPESEVTSCPPPMSTYGFQKLAVEYFCKGAWEQYKVPYTIVRPFNCVGIGEEEAINEHEVTSGNVKLMMSHVLPDIINKILQGQDPLHLLGTGEQVRCYTNGRDIARGIRLALQTPEAENEDFNISTSVPTSVKELAQVVWEILKPGQEFTYVSDPAYLYDVQKRVPDVSKARDILGFEAEIALEDSVREVIRWFRRKKNE